MEIKGPDKGNRTGSPELVAMVTYQSVKSAAVLLWRARVSGRCHLQRRTFDGVQEESGACGHRWIDVLHRRQEATESVSQGILQQVVLGHCADVQETTQDSDLLRWGSASATTNNRVS